jgi:hypothetical protein
MDRSPSLWSRPASRGRGVQHWLHVLSGDRDSPVALDETGYATVSPDTQPGELAALYLTSPVCAIVAILRVEAAAEPAPTDLTVEERYWRTVAVTTPVVVFDPPIELAQIRADDTLSASHAVQMNFQRSVFALTTEQWEAFLTLASRAHPQLREQLDSPTAGTKQVPFASERQLEDYVVDNLDQMATHIGGGPVRLAELARDGIAGRQPVLNGSRSRPDLVVAMLGNDPDVVENYLVVELKNRPAAATELASKRCIRVDPNCRESKECWRQSAYSLRAERRSTVDAG